MESSVNATTVHESAGEEDGNGVNNGSVEGKIGTEEEAGVDRQSIDRSGFPESTPDIGLVCGGGGDSDMEIEDLSEVPPSGDSHSELENGEIRDFNYDPGKADRLSCISADKDTKECSDSLFTDKQLRGCYSVDVPSILPVNGGLSETVVISETLNTIADGEAGRRDFHDEISAGTKKMKGNRVKRPRLMFDENNPSVCVKYNSLTRSSKLKLEELLQQWSEWHAQQALSPQDSDEPLESGEETFFPALNIHLEKATSVSFWMDQQTGKQQNNEFTPLDHKSVPLYDRGYAVGLTSDDGTSNVDRGLEIVDDAARCFNCGSYNHALKECPQPRDHSAVSNARKQLKLKRNQSSSGSRNQARYYQDSPAGKYDGLIPGTLDAETRKLLGLGELDPPPWLSRMRELGYPPGYLDPDEEDQPSGITIFGGDNDEESKHDQEDGEIFEASVSEPERKMSVIFPGINGPIPENADERLWVSSSVDTSRSRLVRRSSSSSHSSEPINIRGHHREERWLSRSEFRDDEPPGVDPGFDPTVSTHLPRYSSSYDSHSSRLDSSGRYEPDRGRRSRFHEEGSFGSSSTRLSPMDYGSSRHRNQVDEIDYATHGSRDWDRDNRDRDRQERYRHLSRW